MSAVPRRQFAPPAQTACSLPAADPHPRCNCWTVGVPRDALQTTLPGAPLPATPWQPKSAFSEGTFGDVPPAYDKGLVARVCPLNPRIMHVLCAGGALGIDLPILMPTTDDGTELTYATMGFCYKCCKFEWLRKQTRPPKTAMQWIPCTKPARTRKGATKQTTKV